MRAKEVRSGRKRGSVRLFRRTPLISRAHVESRATTGNRCMPPPPPQYFRRRIQWRFGRPAARAHGPRHDEDAAEPVVDHGADPRPVRPILELRDEAGQDEGLRGGRKMSRPRPPDLLRASITPAPPSSLFPPHLSRFSLSFSSVSRAWHSRRPNTTPASPSEPQSPPPPPRKERTTPPLPSPIFSAPSSRSDPDEEGGHAVPVDGRLVQPSSPRLAPLHPGPPATKRSGPVQSCPLSP